jgi:SAM-dependent methyltransferase
VSAYGARVGEGEWESSAGDWVTWARSPGHDAHWYYRDAFFDAIVPEPSGRTLEVGCGEGRVARDLVARGHRVIALDTAITLLRAARDEDPHSAYLDATGSMLPFASNSFDLVVAYNSLQVVDDMARTVAEIARVLARHGRLCAVIAHPVTDLGDFVADGRLAIRGDYFERRRVDDIVTQRGLSARLQGWTYSLEDYGIACERAGLLIETMREPLPSRATDRFDRWRVVPLFLFLRAFKP